MEFLKGTWELTPSNGSLSKVDPIEVQIKKKSHSGYTFKFDVNGATYKVQLRTLGEGGIIKGTYSRNEDQGEIQFHPMTPQSEYRGGPADNASYTWTLARKVDATITGAS